MLTDDNNNNNNNNNNSNNNNNNNNKYEHYSLTEPQLAGGRPVGYLHVLPRR